MYSVQLSAGARAFFAKADLVLARKLVRCFEQLERAPRRHPNIRALTGPLAGYFRYRVGDHRVIYRIDESNRVVIVAIIAHRKQVYD
jgi:mRNA interferase RelE/StbE